MVESAYTGASKASARKGLRVRVPLPAPLRGGVLAERARWVGVHVGRGAEPPETPAFRHVAVRPPPVRGPAPPDLVTVRAVPARGRSPGPRYRACGAGRGPAPRTSVFRRVAVRAVSAESRRPRVRGCGGDRLALRHAVGRVTAR